MSASQDDIWQGTQASCYTLGLPWEPIVLTEPQWLVYLMHPDMCCCAMCVAISSDGCRVQPMLPREPTTMQREIINMAALWACVCNEGEPLPGGMKYCFQVEGIDLKATNSTELYDELWERWRAVPTLVRHLKIGNRS